MIMHWAELWGNRFLKTVPVLKVPKKYLNIMCIAVDLWTRLVHWVIDRDARSIICGPNVTMLLNEMKYVDPLRVNVLPPLNVCQSHTTTIFKPPYTCKINFGVDFKYGRLTPNGKHPNTGQLKTKGGIMLNLSVRFYR